MRSVNASSGASAVGFDGRRASQRPRSVASPAMKISRFTRERTGARAYREPVAHFYPWTGAWTRTLAEAALGAEVAGATCIVVKLAQRDCISRVERRRRASRYVGTSAGQKKAKELSIGGEHVSLFRRMTGK